MGHDVQLCGDYEYCLGCGRETQAKHIAAAKIISWRRQYCKPTVSLMDGGHAEDVLQKDPV
eukprot:10143523-Heterocapsa_arctica.AAC.1